MKFQLSQFSHEFGRDGLKIVVTQEDFTQDSESRKGFSRFLKYLGAVVYIFGNWFNRPILSKLFPRMIDRFSEAVDNIVEELVRDVDAALHSKGTSSAAVAKQRLLPSKPPAADARDVLDHAIEKGRRLQTNFPQTKNTLNSSQEASRQEPVPDVFVDFVNSIEDDDDNDSPPQD